MVEPLPGIGPLVGDVIEHAKPELDALGKAGTTLAKKGAEIAVHEIPPGISGVNVGETTAGVVGKVSWLSRIPVIGSRLGPALGWASSYLAAAGPYLSVAGFIFWDGTEPHRAPESPAAPPPPSSEPKKLRPSGDSDNPSEDDLAVRRATNTAAWVRAHQPTSTAQTAPVATATPPAIEVHPGPKRPIVVPYRQGFKPATDLPNMSPSKIPERRHVQGGQGQLETYIEAQRREDAEQACLVRTSIPTNAIVASAGGESGGDSKSGNQKKSSSRYHLISTESFLNSSNGLVLTYKIYVPYSFWNEISVGRSLVADIGLGKNEKSISREHLRIRREINGSYTLTVWGKNGVQYKGRKYRPTLNGAAQFIIPPNEFGPDGNLKSPIQLSPTFQIRLSLRPP